MRLEEITHYIARYDKYKGVFIPVFDKPIYPDGAIVVVSNIDVRLNGDGLDKRATQESSGLVGALDKKD